MVVGINPGVLLNDVGRLIVNIVGYAPNVSVLYITSGMDGDHGAVSHHYGTLTYQGSPTAAADIGGGGVTSAGSRNMRDFARWVYDTFPRDVVELIHTTPYANDQGFYIRHGVKVPNGTGWLDAATKAAHLNHVHLAMSKAGAVAVNARLTAGRPAPTLPKIATSTMFVDVSFHDWDRKGGKLDWAAIASAGLGQVMCARASYGDPQVFSPASPRFGEFMTAAKAAGFSTRGAYHNLIRGDQASINRQVDLLRATMDKHGGEWAMADVEAYDELIQRGLVPRWEDAQRFHDRWYQVEPTVVMAWYISRHFWRDHWGSLPDLKALRGPLCNANYPGGTGTARDIYAGAGAETGRGWAPYGGRTPDVWQYTDTATVPGASDRTDCNAFRGSRAALVAMLTGMTRGDDILPLSDDDAEVLIWRVEALINNRPTVIGNSVATGQPNVFAQALANLAAAVTAIASKVDIDPAELEAIKRSAAAGVLAAVPAITDAIVARLPADAIPRGEVEQAVRDAVASETPAVPKQALGP